MLGSGDAAGTGYRAGHRFISGCPRSPEESTGRKIIVKCFISAINASLGCGNGGAPRGDRRPRLSGPSSRFMAPYWTARVFRPVVSRASRTWGYGSMFTRAWIQYCLFCFLMFRGIYTTVSATARKNARMTDHSNIRHAQCSLTSVI